MILQEFATQQLSLIGNNTDLLSAFQSVFSGVTSLAQSKLTVLGPKIFQLAQVNFSPNFGRSMQSFLSAIFDMISVQYQGEISAAGSQLGNLVEVNISNDFRDDVFDLMKSLFSTIRQQFPDWTEISILFGNLRKFLLRFISNFIIDALKNVSNERKLTTF